MDYINHAIANLEMYTRRDLQHQYDEGFDAGYREGLHHPPIPVHQQVKDLQIQLRDWKGLTVVALLFAIILGAMCWKRSIDNEDLKSLVNRLRTTGTVEVMQ